jgi:methionyl-tRNA synthetase
VAALSHPVIPDATSKIWAQLGLGDIRKFPLSELKWGQLELGARLGNVEAVFPRADKSAIERMQTMEEQQRSASSTLEAQPEASAPAVETPATNATPLAKPASSAPDGKISIDDFAKVELRVGQVKAAEKVKGADKLLRLEVDLGTEVRQVVAGIAESYAPELLIGRKVVIVANLAPRKLRGLESNGMIVAASPEGGKAVLASFLEDVPVGTRLK